MLIGCDRVSTDDQDTAAQVAAGLADVPDPLSILKHLSLLPDVVLGFGHRLPPS